MSAGIAPRLTGGIAASVLFHGALIGAFFLLGPAREPPAPPMYRVQLFAAPPGERAAGVVQAQPQTPPVTPAAPAPAPIAAPTPAVAKTTVARPTTPAAKTKPAPKLATPTAKTVPAGPAKAAAPAPTAGGGQTGGRGADVANVDTPGIEFPFPAYTTNIVSQLIRRFGPMAGTLSATVRFVIRRDGTVDLESIKIVTPSGNYSFDQRAVGAVESAANAKAFTPLPSAFPEDILPVTFRFSPAIVR
ncbi:MAG: TonB protein [Gemmatimonadetes bacterium]|nr:TonB protein [Gemmatimonadota bacterium]